MLIGEYKHKMDEKFRVSLPSRFRKNLGNTIVLTRGLERCVFAYNLSRWKEITDRLSKLDGSRPERRKFLRFFISGATEVDIDSAGRILVPRFLLEFADLKQNKEVIIAGVQSRIELWNEEKWEEYKTKMENDEALTDNLGEIGAL
ncbi:MAG: division/cell wall cluster transcriptional repressor MraZ [Candidatus Campbellbacteria bacterium]|nr:division/cell wall cluster transcriptional repressor MraZ [Candidatus Campbellbacteria bacterium]